MIHKDYERDIRLQTLLSTPLNHEYTHSHVKLYKSLLVIKEKYCLTCQSKCMINYIKNDAYKWYSIYLCNSSSRCEICMHKIRDEKRLPKFYSRQSTTYLEYNFCLSNSNQIFRLWILWDIKDQWILFKFSMRMYEEIAT